MAGDKEEKIYVGKGKAFGRFNQLSFSVSVDAIQPYVFEIMGKKYIKLVIGEMRQPDDRGKTHTVWVDTWKPDPNKAQDKPRDTAPYSERFRKPAKKVVQEEVPPPIDEEGIDPNDIPF